MTKLQLSYLLKGIASSIFLLAVLFFRDSDVFIYIIVLAYALVTLAWYLMKSYYQAVIRYKCFALIPSLKSIREVKTIREIRRRS